MSQHNTDRPRLTLIVGGKVEDTCRCDDSDVYDGWAECPEHPHTGGDRG